MRIRQIKNLDELDCIEPDWKKLQDQKGRPTIFQSWEWNRSWCELVLGKRKQARLAVRVIEDGSGIQAIVPLFEEPLIRPFVSIAQFLGHRMSYHNDVLMSDPGSRELAGEVVRLLLRDLGVTTILHLRHLTSGSSFTKELVALKLAVPQCPRLLIYKDQAITEQSMRLGKATRKSYRRRKNQLFHRHDCEFKVIRDKNFPMAFDEFIELHRRRFSSTGRNTLMEGLELEFLKYITSKFSELGKFEILQLRVDEKLIAAQLLAIDRGCYFGINTGFDPDFSRYSPLRILAAETLRRGYDELDCNVHDLGPGYETYKYDWHPFSDKNYFLCCGSNLYTRFLASGYQYLFRRSLPSLDTLP